MILSMAILVLDAFLRTVFNQPILFTIDAVTILLAWCVFSAFAWALSSGAHVRMTLVVDRLPSRLRSACGILGNLVGVAFFATLTILAANYSWKSLLIKEMTASPIPAPLWLAKLALPLGTGLILLLFLLRLIRLLHPKSELVEKYSVTKF